MVYRTAPELVAVHDSGWIRLPSGVEVTRLPLVEVDCPERFARIGAGAARQWCAAHGARLPTAAELDELHASALYIEPYTLPTVAMIHAAGIGLADTALIDRFRTTHMSGEPWARLHDAQVWLRLHAAEWTDQAVANAGKHWCAGGIYGWWRADGSMIQPLYAGHGDDHTDYATTTHAARAAGEGDGAWTPRRTIRRGDSGPAVREWQQVLRDDGHVLLVDGLFGAVTHRETRGWQRDEGLTDDGIVGPLTWAAAAAADTQPEPSGLPITWRAARHFSPGRPLGIHGVCIHTAECAETPAAAEALASWAAGQQAPRVSWHYAVASDSITQSVLDTARAWAVGRNHAQDTGLHIELAGRAAQTAEQWADAYSAAQLDLAARLVAHLCRVHAIPVRRLSVPELRAGERGIYGHADVTAAWPGTTTHSDPGPAFPWAALIALARQYR